MSTPPTDEANGVRPIRLLVCLMFFTFAMTTDAVGSVIPRVVAEFALTLTQASAFQYASMAGIAAGALLLGFLADRLGRKRAIVLGLALYGAASLLFAAGDQFAAFVALLVLSGFGISVFKIGALALIGDVSFSTASHTRFMNTVEGFFGVGAIVGPAIVALLISAGMSWKWLYVVAAVMCVLLIALAARVRYPAIKGRAERADLREVGAVLKDPLALGVVALVMLYVAVESAIYVWMPSYLLDYRGSFPWLAGSALTLFFALRAAGRFLGAWLLARVPWAAALALVTLAIALCFGGALALHGDVAALLLPLSGLFMSIVYPTLNSKGMSCFPKAQHGAAAGVILFFTAAAAAGGPLAMGMVSDAYGSTRAGFVLGTGLACLLFAGALANWLLDPARARLQAFDRSDYGAAALASPEPAAAPST